MLLMLEEFDAPLVTLHEVSETVLVVVFTPAPPMFGPVTVQVVPADMPVALHEIVVGFPATIRAGEAVIAGVTAAAQV